MYTIKPFQMTPNTLVYQVYYNGVLCFYHYKEDVAQKIIKMFEENNVTSRQSYNVLPFTLRKKFILATMKERPYFAQ